MWVYDESQHKRKKGKEGVVALHWHPPVKLWRHDAGGWRLEVDLGTAASALAEGCPSPIDTCDP